MVALLMCLLLLYRFQVSEIIKSPFSIKNGGEECSGKERGVVGSVVYQNIYKRTDRSEATPPMRFYPPFFLCVLQVRD